MLQVYIIGQSFYHYLHVTVLFIYQQMFLSAVLHDLEGACEMFLFFPSSGSWPF